MGDITEEIAIEVLAPVTLILVAIVILGNYFHVHHIRWMPEAAVSVLAGIAVGAILYFVIGTDDIIEAFISFNSTVFTLCLLPPVIFWSGYQVYRDDFYTEMKAILVFAIFGTIISVFIIGVPLHYSGIAGLGLAEALMFGSLISAVDPVATLAVFGSLGVDPRLNIIVFGESILNDAVSIVLYRGFEKFNGPEGFSTVQLSNAVFEFFLVMVGSTLIGGAVGMMASLILKLCNFSKNPIAETQNIFLLGLFSFYLAEGSTLSGIISTFTSGIVMGMYADRNLSKAGKRFTHGFLETVSAFADIVIFFKIGMSAFSQNYNPDMQLGLVSLFLCFVGRACNIFPLAYLLNLSRVQKIPFKHQVIMWHAGLRGAIAFSLALGMDTANSKEIVFATMFIALATVFGCGCTTAWVLKLMKVEVGIESGDNSCFSIHGKKRRGLLHVHKNYLRPFLLKRDVWEEQDEGKINEYNNDLTITTLRRFHPELKITSSGPTFENFDENNKFRRLFDQVLNDGGDSGSSKLGPSNGADVPWVVVKEPPSPASTLRFHKETSDKGSGGITEPLLAGSQRKSSSSSNKRSVDIRTMFQQPPVMPENIPEVVLDRKGKKKKKSTNINNPKEDSDTAPNNLTETSPKTDTVTKGTENKDYSTFNNN
eukprot:Nk52_evm49s230 gene=Nk52_evmTU49s230